MTDTPMFVSGKYLVIFDPHQRYIRSGGTGPCEPGKRIKFTPRQGGCDSFDIAFRRIFGPVPHFLSRVIRGLLPCNALCNR